MRFRKLVIKFNSFNIWKKKLVVKLNNLSGRDISGQKVVRTKKNNKNKYYITIGNLSINNTGLILGLYFSNIYQHFYFLLKTSNNIYFYVKGISGLFVGDYIYKYNVLNMNTNLSNGMQLLAGLCVKNNIISNVIINKNLKTKKIASASGTYCSIIHNNLELSLLKIKLPSGRKTIISNNSKVVIGRNSFLEKKYQFYSKAGYLKNLGKNQIVRGVAMNPVDHPHGGRTKTNSPEVSIWGWVTKHSH